MPHSTATASYAIRRTTKKGILCWHKETSGPNCNKTNMIFTLNACIQHACRTLSSGPSHATAGAFSKSLALLTRSFNSAEQDLFGLTKIVSVLDTTRLKFDAVTSCFRKLCQFTLLCWPTVACSIHATWMSQYGISAANCDSSVSVSMVQSPSCWRYDMNRLTGTRLTTVVSDKSVTSLSVCTWSGSSSNSRTLKLLSVCPVDKCARISELVPNFVAMATREGPG